MDVVIAVPAGDRTWAALLSVVTEVAGHRPTVTHTSADTELSLRSRGYDLVVADPDVAAPAVLAPGTDGTPPLVAWLRAPSSDRVAQLLAAGAEDVLDPSMAAVELAARLQRVATRRAGHVMPQPASLGALRVDARLREASWQDRELGLTPREVEVLQVLVAASGRPVAREAVYRQVWRWSMPRGDRTVDVNVKRLRGKLAAAGVPVRIVTQPGIGYRIDVEGAEPTVTGL